MLYDRNVYAVIGAAGSGIRMAAPMPKQFIKIGGETILEKTVSVFLRHCAVDKIVIVTSSDYLEFTEELFKDAKEADRISVVCGGKQRQDSVYSGLCALREYGAQDDSIVLIHDGVRPYVSEALVSAVAEAAAQNGAAVPAVAPKDTIRTRSGETLDRDSLCCVQTPQAFRMELIEKAFEQAFADAFYGTDDAGLTDRIGVRAAIVEGEYENIKITTPEDLKMEYRIGTGYDVHRLEPDRKLVLGGVCIPFEKGLLGHSDADVLVHALMDAMLGAAGLGDIGKMFPDSDPAYSGISSILLLEKTGKAVSEAGYYLGNADITVICQRPRLAPYIEQMRENIAAALTVPKDRISIKATTTEKLGFTGRGEGIASEAVCLLNR